MKIKKIPKSDFLNLRQEVRSKLEKSGYTFQKGQVVFYMTADRRSFKFIF